MNRFFFFRKRFPAIFVIWSKGSVHNIPFIMDGRKYINVFRCFFGPIMKFAPDAVLLNIIWLEPHWRIIKHRSEDQ